MYAFRTAVRDAGSHMLELDVSATSDGELVVMHDWTVDRTTDGTGYLTDERVRAVVSVRTRGARGAPLRARFRLGR